MCCTDKFNIIIFHHLNSGNTPDLLEIRVRWCLPSLHLEKQTGKHHKMLAGEEIGVWQVQKVYYVSSYLHGYLFPSILFYFIINHFFSMEIGDVSESHRKWKLCERENMSRFKTLAPRPHVWSMSSRSLQSACSRFLLPEHLGITICPFQITDFVLLSASQKPSATTC